MRHAQDSDAPPLRTPRKNFGDAALLGAGAMSAGGSGLLPGDFATATAGTPSNLGKIGEAGMSFPTCMRAWREPLFQPSPTQIHWA